MVSEDSELYRKHPEWALTIPNRKPVRGRNQLVLDFSRKEVVDAIYEQICNILDQGKIEYLKWDMNRSITDVYSTLATDQGKVLYDYMLGLYDFLERLNQRYPELLIEGCSGGGGRFDAGMLYYTPQLEDLLPLMPVQDKSFYYFALHTIDFSLSLLILNK